MAFAEGVAAGHQGHGLLHRHAHAGEGVAHVAAGGDRIGVAVGPLGVHVDEAHLHRRQGLLEAAVVGVALIAQPAGLPAPEHVLLRLPDVGATAGEAEGGEAHRFERHIAGQDDQIGPGDGVAVAALDRPEQPAGLVEVGVVRPAVERRETLVAVGGAAATVGTAVGAGAVPGHADEQGAVVAPVGGPPGLRVGHQRAQIALERLVVEPGEGTGVVEAGAERIGGRMVLMQDPQIDDLRPPLAVAGGPGGSHGAMVSVEGALQVRHRRVAPGAGA